LFRVCIEDEKFGGKHKANKEIEDVERREAEIEIEEVEGVKKIQTK